VFTSSVFIAGIMVMQRVFNRSI